VRTVSLKGNEKGKDEYTSDLSESPQQSGASICHHENALLSLLPAKRGETQSLGVTAALAHQYQMEYNIARYKESVGPQAGPDIILVQ
jgi:uncharacterized protein YbgA (DUF1722 family)